MKRGDSTTTVVLFLLTILAALILVTWYVESIRPVRYIVGAVNEDVLEIDQHLRNACSATIYRARYVPTSQSTLEVNASHLCLYGETYSRCSSVPCHVEPVRMLLREGMTINITREAGVVILRT